MLLSATERISGLIGRLQQLPGSQEETPKAVDVGNVVARMEEKIEATVGKAVTLELPVESSAWALAKSDELEDVILAIAATMRNANARIIITCTSELLLEHTPQVRLEPGIYTAVAIHRDGPALDHKARAAVFESFPARQSEQASIDTLARAYRTVRDLSGDIALSSDHSRGCLT